MSALEHHDYAEARLSEIRRRGELVREPEVTISKPRPAKPRIVGYYGEVRRVDQVNRLLGAPLFADEVADEITAYENPRQERQRPQVLRGIPVIGGAAGAQPGTDPEQAQTDLWCDCGRGKQPWFRTCKPCHLAKR